MVLIHNLITFFLAKVASQLKGQDSKATSSVTHIVDYISDDYLTETALSVFLERVAFLLTAFRDINLQKQFKCAGKILWDLLKKSNYQLKEIFAKFVSEKPQFITFTLKGMCSYLGSYGKLLKANLLYMTNMNRPTHELVEGMKIIWQ